MTNKFYSRHNGNTRNNDIVQPEYQRLSICPRTMSFSGPQVLNCLALEICKIQTSDKIEEHLKFHPLDLYKE